MQNLYKMSLADIIDECGFVFLYPYDVDYIFKENNEELRKGFLDEIAHYDMKKDAHGVIKVLKKYENYIDKEKLLLIMYQNMILRNMDDVEEMMTKAESLIDQINKEIYFFIDVGYSFKVVTNKNLNNKNLYMEIYNYREKCIDKLSKKTIVQLLYDNSTNKNEVYDHNGLRKRIIRYLFAESLINLNVKEVSTKYEEIDQITFLMENVDKINDDLFQYTMKNVCGHIDINKMCLVSFANIYKNLEDGIYNDEQRTEKESMLKELYSVIKGQDIEVEFEQNDEKFSSKDAQNVMERFYGEIFYTVDDIEESLKNTLEYGIMPDEDYITYIKKYIKTSNRKIKDVNELKFFLKYMFSKEEILQLYLNGQIKIEDIKTLKLENEKNKENFEIISDKDFIKEYKKLQEKNKKIKNKAIENELEQLGKLYASTNAIGVDREEHITNILEKINSNNDLQYLLQMGIINEDELKIRSKIIEEKENNAQKAEMKEKLNSTEGVLNLLESGELTEREIIEKTVKGDISKKTFIQMYVSGKIHLNTIKECAKNYDLNQFITNDDIINAVAAKKGQANYKKEMNLLALYRRLKNKQEEEKGKKASEIKEEYKDFILFLEVALEEQGKSDTSSEDRIKLYNSGILPIDTIIEWGDKEELTNILSSGKLKLNDIKELYSRKIIDNNEVTSIIKAGNATLAQKVALLSMVYNDNEEYRNQNLQMLFETIKEREKGNKKGKIIEEKQDENLKKMLSDNAEMVKALISIDNETEIETTEDGHIIVHMPNTQGGIVVIEKLYSIDTTKDAIKPKKGNDIYIIDEYEYIAREEDIIKDRSVSKRELRELEKEGISKRQLNVSSDSIKNVLKNGINPQRYSEVEKNDIVQMANESKEITI